MNKSPIPYLLATALAAAATAPASGAEQDVVIRRVERDSPRVSVKVHKGDQPRIHVRRIAGEREMEKVAFLGVQTMPVGRTLAAQLGLPRDTGLVVLEVVEDSPAASALQPHDILLKLDDQILIDQRQLAVLIRQRKEGDEVTLTLYRGGKETKSKVKLAEREVPKLVLREGSPLRGEIAGDLRSELEGPALRELHELPGMEPGQVGDVIRMIGRSREGWLDSPRVHVFGHGEEGMTILDLPRGNIVYSDDEGSVEVKAGKDERELTIKDPQGKVVFEGPINTPEEREKLPAEVRERLNRIEKAQFSFDLDHDFRSGGADVRPEAGLRKIRLPARPATPERRAAPAF